MALPDYIGLMPGSAKHWEASLGDGALTLTSLGNGSGRSGDKLDFHDATLGYPEVLEILFATSVGSAATNGNQVELYFAESDSPTAGLQNPAGLTGVDAAVTSPDEKKLQCELVGGLNLSNALGTAVQSQRFRYYPVNRYIIPFVVNKSGQSLGATGTDHIIIVTPWYRTVTD